MTTQKNRKELAIAIARKIQKIEPTEADIQAILNGKDLFQLFDEKVAYLGEIARKRYELHFYPDGKGSAFVKRRAADSIKYVPFNTRFERTNRAGTGTAIFVVPPDKKLYAGTHIPGKFHHSSFLSGGAVLGGGEMRTDDDGYITLLSNVTGHYKIEEAQEKIMLEFFKDKGVNLDKVKYHRLYTLLDKYNGTTSIVLPSF